MAANNPVAGTIFQKQTWPHHSLNPWQAQHFAAAACLLLPPPADVLLPPEGKESEERGSKEREELQDVTPAKTRGMAVRTF